MNKDGDFSGVASATRVSTRMRSSRNRLGLSPGSLDGNFLCVHCRQPVPYDPVRAGVHHRNHCPYCLWSRHLDLFHAGDRLAACRAPMRPVGLAHKRSRKKYAGRAPGELMVVHQCEECGKVSMNRIAADDWAEELWEIFQRSLDLDPAFVQDLERSGIAILGAGAARTVRGQLLGQFEGLPSGRSPSMDSS